jgi:DNA-binding beta-propeller fold protein YncE
MSPAGGYAASLILNGTGGAPKDAFYRHQHSYVALLRITGKTVRKVGEGEVGGLAEGIAFSPDGRFIYVGNFIDGDLYILRIDGNSLHKVGSLTLPGHPASMRGNSP